MGRVAANNSILLNENVIIKKLVYYLIKHILKLIFMFSVVFICNLNFMIILMYLCSDLCICLYSLSFKRCKFVVDLSQIRYINNIWKPPSLSDLTPIVSFMELTHLDSKASK